MIVWNVGSSIRSRSNGIHHCLLGKFLRYSDIKSSRLPVPDVILSLLVNHLNMAKASLE